MSYKEFTEYREYGIQGKMNKKIMDTNVYRLLLCWVAIEVIDVHWRDKEKANEQQ